MPTAAPRSGWPFTAGASGGRWGISVMKAFAGGQLLDARTSPFGQALTQYQCIQYALDKPGVLTVLPGIRDLADVKQLLGFLTASPEERDYSILGTFTPKDVTGTCVYCNHCQPCRRGWMWD